MTVGELIDELQSADPELPVMVMSASVDSDGQAYGEAGLVTPRVCEAMLDESCIVDLPPEEAAGFSRIILLSPEEG